MNGIRRWQGLFFFALILTACEPDAVEPGVYPSPANTRPAATLKHILDLPPVFSPTITPTFTASATPTHTETPSHSPSPSQPIVRQPSDTLDPSPAPCQNVLYPLATGRRWNYGVHYGETENSVIVTVIDAEGKSALVDLFDESNDAHSSFLVDCSDGTLTEFSIAEIGFLFFPNGASLEVKSTSGLLAPSRRQFEGKDWEYSWSTGMTASGEMVLQDLPLGEAILEFQDAPVLIEWESTGETETLQTPAGTFTEVRTIIARARFDLVIKIGGGVREQSFPAVLEVAAELWYQPNIGLLKQRFTSGEVFLQGNSCPISFLSQLELVSYDFSP